MNHPDRRRGLARWIALFILAASTALADPPHAPFELKDGDRVVFLGGTFIEREQSYGYLETLLTSRFPDRNITFRNLGWSGDNVWGEARARFGKVPEGFAHLKEHVEALKPTVIFVNYGLNESFAGKAGLPEFEMGLNTLLDVLDKTRARIVLITPRQLENLGPPLPDPAKANERLADYVAVLRRIGSSRGYRIVDLFEDWKPGPPPIVTSSGIRITTERDRIMTDNGLHLTENGYSTAARIVMGSMGLGHEPRLSDTNFVLLPDGTQIMEKSASLKGSDVAFDSVKAARRGLSFRATLSRLPEWNPSLSVSIHRMSPGNYELKIDGKAVKSTSATGEMVRFSLENRPEHDQAEALRAAIIAKNELYFYRWRPQNETYLFGFRKHEQGNNAVEIPKFDPLVAAKEAEIAKLRVPKPHTYEIIRKEEGR